MSVPMEEREGTDDHGPQGYRRPYSERNEHSQQDDRPADGLLDENDLQTRARRCKAAQHRCHEGCRPHHNGTATGEHTPEAYHRHSDEVVCPVQRMRNSGAERIAGPYTGMGAGREDQRFGQHNADQD
jgi:hypothetical protein